MEILKKAGRPLGTLSGKYKDSMGKPIGVYQWRRENGKEKNIMYRERNILYHRKKEAMKYNLELEEFIKLKSSCTGCGFSKYPVDIHHIDKNNKNNVKENLIALCPTCHLGIHRGYLKLPQIKHDE